MTTTQKKTVKLFDGDLPELALYQDYREPSWRIARSTP